MKLDNWLARSAAAVPDRPALLSEERQISYGELERLASATARRLATLGIERNERVALMLAPSVEYVVLLHALMKLGAVAVPLDARSTAAERGPLLDRVKPRLVITAFEQVLEAREADHAGESRIDTGALQCIIHTSGTGGTAKPVGLTYANHLWNAVGSGVRLGIDPDDRWLCCLSLHHVGGLAIVLRSVIYGTTVVLERFEPDAVRGLIEADQVTIASLVGTMLQRLLDAEVELDRLRCLLLGGGPAPEALLQRALEAGIPLAPTYGLTEAASQVATLPPEEARRKPGSAGPPILPCDLRIDEDGMILVRGPTVAPGAAGSDGWLRTGDVGRLDQEGHLFVEGRADDVIVTGGENVSPEEVEQALRAHPDVADAAVIGRDDSEWQQAVVAAVVVRKGAEVRVEALRAFCGKRLAGFKVPKEITFVSELPRDAQGKLRRALLRR